MESIAWDDGSFAGELSTMRGGEFSMKTTGSAECAMLFGSTIDDAHTTQRQLQSVFISNGKRIDGNWQAATT